MLMYLSSARSFTFPVPDPAGHCLYRRILSQVPPIWIRWAGHRDRRRTWISRKSSLPTMPHPP